MVKIRWANTQGIQHRRLAHCNYSVNLPVIMTKQWLLRQVSTNRTATWSSCTYQGFFFFNLNTVPGIKIPWSWQFKYTIPTSNRKTTVSVFLLLNSSKYQISHYIQRHQCHEDSYMFSVPWATTVKLHAFKYFPPKLLV